MTGIMTLAKRILLWYNDFIGIIGNCGAEMVSGAIGKLCNSELKIEQEGKIV